MPLWQILAICVAFVAAQWVWSFFDGWAFLYQLAAQRIPKGYVIWQHGGLVADVTIIPVAAAIILKYRLAWQSWQSGAVVAAAVIIAIALAWFVYQPAGVITPEAHTHFGHTPATGWIHAVFLALGLSVWGIWIFAPLDRPIMPEDLLAVALLLSAWALLGVMKFSPDWHWTKPVALQVAGLVALIWAISAARAWLFVPR